MERFSLKWLSTEGLWGRASLLGILEDTRVNQKVKAIFKLRGNRDREELAHCAVLTMPVEEFSDVQYSALPSVEWRAKTWTLLCKIAPSKNDVA